jgi:hypothetical protein
MSPERKFEPDALLNPRDAASASVFDEGADETAKIAVPKVKAAENSKKRSVKTTIHGGESTLYSRGKSNEPATKIEYIQSAESRTRSSSQVTPKANGANKPQRSSLPSFSPIDYRPQNHDANVADSPKTTSMLKSYVEQWSQPPSDNEYADHDATIDKRTQPILEMNRTDSTGIHDGPLPSSWENNVHSPAMAYENLDVEYGRLALIKQDLERKIQVRDLNARAHGGVTEISERPNPLVEQHFSTTMSDRKNDMGPSIPGVRDSLEHEYGQLTFFKRQLERKMQMQNHDARNLDPWMPRASFPETTNDNAVATREGIAGRDETPSREDVAFGEMAYRRRMAELGTPMIKFLVRPTDDGDYAATNYKDGKNDFAKHHPDHYYKNYDSAYARSPSKAKTKKRRKRRVVETITRVIHEESEEEGSASTGGGGHGWNLKDHRPRTDRCSSSEKRHGEYRHTNYRKDPNVEPSGYSRGRIFSPKKEARKPRNSGKDYTAYDESDIDSSDSLDNHERRSLKPKGWMRKETLPPRSESTDSTLPEKKRQKRNQDLNNRNRIQMSQPSMLESLH